MATIPTVTFDSIVEKTKQLLGENYREQEEDTLKSICMMVIYEAAEFTNRFRDEQLDEVMNECWPVIVKSACIAYLNRGSEGLGSQSELGQQNVYNDWVAFMHKQITNRRYVI